MLCIGNIFVGGYNCIQVIDKTTLEMVAIAGQCFTTIDCCGQDGSSATSFPVYTDTKIHIDTKDTIIISDPTSRHIVKFSNTVSPTEYPTLAPSSSEPYSFVTAAGGGDNDYDGAAATSTKLLYPYGVAVDTSGMLLTYIRVDIT